VDCAPLVVAQEMGLFAKHGLNVELRKAQSWDQAVVRLAAGDLEAAHMLITIPLQWALGPGGAANPLVYAAALSGHGNAITVSNALWRDGVRDAANLKDLLSRHVGRSLPPQFAVVHPRSTHEYVLRLWLEAAGLEIGRDVALRYVPPHEMVHALREGTIDGFCAGEPWNQRAAHSKLGYIVTTSCDVLPPLNEKVLAVRASWHRENTAAHASLIRAVREAAGWLADPGHLAGAADMVAGKHYVNTPREPVLAALSGKLQAGGGRVLQPEGFLRMSGPDVNRPDPATARFYLEQMVRFGHVSADKAAATKVEEICLEGFYDGVVRA
jgi:ABC-type nitrate/sulfonate/bicarbonate transport system substrate-binding protein